MVASGPASVPHSVPQPVSLRGGGPALERVPSLAVPERFQGMATCPPHDSVPPAAAASLLAPVRSCAKPVNAVTASAQDHCAR